MEVRRGKPDGPVCVDCGVTILSFQSEGFTDMASAIEHYHESDSFQVKFGTAWSVQTKSSHPSFRANNVGGSLRVGMQIEIPKILVTGQDFEA